MNKSNKNVTFKEKPLTVLGNEIKEGQIAPNFKLVGKDMGDVSLDNFKGKVLVLSVVPSLDTPTCAIQTKRFNKEAANLSKDTVILTVSMDLPFAQSRWCGAEEVENIVTASDYKYRSFGEAYGALIKEMGLLTRAVFVIGKDGKVAHVEYVASISDEPDYNSALEKVKAAAK